MMRKKSSGHGHGGHGGHRNNRGRKFRSGGGGGGGHNDSQSLARQKKHAMTQKDKYLTMARDAQSNGDRVNAEYYYQHVEHYSRTIAEIEEKETPAQREMDDAADAGEGADSSNDEAAEATEGDVEAAPRQQHSRQRNHSSRTQARTEVNKTSEETTEAGEIPLPTGLFGADENDRAANG